MKKNQLKDQTLFLIGGGPSLASLDLAYLYPRQSQVLVSNNGYKLFPNALVAHHADWAWWEWHQHTFFEIYKGPNPTTCSIGGNKAAYPPAFKYYQREDRYGLSDNFPFIRGSNAGYQLLNIAYILGAKNIILLGYDLKHGPNGETQWHNEHQRETNTGMWEKKMLPEFNMIAKGLKKVGVNVYNANPDSAITCFEFIDGNEYTKFL